MNFWIAGGADPVAYLENYPDHYRLMHVKDMREQVRFKGDGGDASLWMELFPYMDENLRLCVIPFDRG